MSLIILLVLLLLPLLLTAPWGPGNHLELAHRVARRRSEDLPADVARLLNEERPAYLYGNIAADLITLKSFGGHGNHCHRWTIIEDMREVAETPRQQAFILGYLSHLAADTISHNHFVPFHLARFARTRGLGHLYWEMSADRHVPEQRWDLLTEILSAERLEGLDELVNLTVPKKALSMGTNRLIFNEVVLLSRRQGWRRNITRLQPLERVGLRKKFLARFQRAAVDRIVLALSPRGIERLAHVDTSGKAAQKQAMQLRKGTRARWAPRRLDEDESRRMAATFLEGMESPPRGTGAPHWS